MYYLIIGPLRFVMAPRPSVVIYNDVGTNCHCVKQLRSCIQQNILRANVLILNAAESIAKLSCKSIDLFCVGGGFARGVIGKLGSIGLECLRSFVLSGGSYLGICSGAYLASSITKFDIGGPLEVDDAGMLNFFPGTFYFFAGSATMCWSLLNLVLPVRKIASPNRCRLFS